MKKNRKIAIIGHFGGSENLLDGQTIKTKILYEELLKATNWNIKKVDTYYKTKRPLKLLISSLFNIIFCKDIVVLLSENGMKFYFPILYFFSTYCKKNIYHDVIGGNLHKHIINNAKYKKYLNSFKYNWVETNNLKIELEKIGINNCDVIPNFKRLSINSEIDVEMKETKEEYKFCTFSRVMKEKGISNAIKAIRVLNESENDKHKHILDIYGPIDEKYLEEFNKEISEAPNFIKYCGEVPYDKSVDVLKKYDILLFPTYWSGEGFPGTIIDAFFAGVPVIASDWNCNREIISNNINGIVYPNENEKTLTDSIKKIINNYQLLIKMKKNCIEEAKNYKPDKYISKIKEMIERS